MSDPPDLFASFSDHAIKQGIVHIDLELLASDWVAIPFYEQWNGRWLGPSSRSWGTTANDRWINLTANEHTIDLYVALTMLSDAVGYLNWFTEVALIVGAPTEIEAVTGVSASDLFMESCANTFGQGVALLKRHSETTSVYANFGKLFPHPFRV